MELVIEELPTQPMHQKLEEFIPSDAIVVTVKINLHPDIYDLDQNRGTVCLTVKRYLEHYNVKILAATAGLHINGKNKKPHIHYHLICERFTPDGNPSQHRKRWCSKHDENMDGMSFMFRPIDLGAAKFQTLAYPLKEGLVCKDPSVHLFDLAKMPIDMLNFLRDTGKAIYDKALALRERQDKCDERKQNALLDLYEKVKDINFNSFREMMNWLDIHYILKLELENYPDPKNYKTNCHKIAIKKGLMKYSDL